MDDAFSFNIKFEDRLTPFCERMAALASALPEDAPMQREFAIEDLVSFRCEGLICYVEPSALALETLAELERLIGQ